MNLTATLGGILNALTDNNPNFKGETADVTFKAATGMTPGSYRLNLRINGARRLLATGAALSEAAYAMGFADQAHLQRAFKAHHALTPGCYARGA